MCFGRALHLQPSDVLTQQQHHVTNAFSLARREVEGFQAFQTFASSDRVADGPYGPGSQALWAKSLHARGSGASTQGY